MFWHRLRYVRRKDLLYCENYKVREKRKQYTIHSWGCKHAKEIAFPSIEIRGRFQHLGCQRHTAGDSRGASEAGEAPFGRCEPGLAGIGRGRRFKALDELHRRQEQPRPREESVSQARLSLPG